MATSDKANVAFARFRRQSPKKNENVTKHNDNDARNKKKGPHAKQRARGTPIVPSSRRKEGKTEGRRRGKKPFNSLFLICLRTVFRNSFKWPYRIP